MLEQLIRDNIKGYGILALKIKNPEAAELDLIHLYQLMVICVWVDPMGITIATPTHDMIYKSCEEFEEFIGLANCTVVGGKPITLQSLGL